MGIAFFGVGLGTGMSLIGRAGNVLTKSSKSAEDEVAVSISRSEYERVNGYPAASIDKEPFSNRIERSIPAKATEDVKTSVKSHSKDPEVVLYADNEVKRIFAKWSDPQPGDETFLRVVPSGTSLPLKDVFAALEIDLGRLGKPEASGFHHVVFLSWQVSPSYLLTCMTAINDSRNDGVGYTDPERQLYGIRLVPR